LFTFGLLLFSLGVAVWLIGLVLRIAIRLFQLGLLIVWTGVAFASWLQRRRKVIVLEGEILPPQRALPRPTKLLLFAGMLVLVATAAHADDWQQRAKEPASGHAADKRQVINADRALPAASENDHQPCVLYANQEDGRLHVRIPVCFFNIYMESQDGYLTFNNRKAGALHPAVKCTGIVESVERVDPTTFLVRLYCKGATPERDAVSVQLIGDTIHIFNVETN
jgi:hypothetical protein